MTKSDLVKKPMAEANRLSSMLRLVVGSDRFPVDVKTLATEYSLQCFSDSPITKIHAEALDGFEGMLAANRTRQKWMIVYNNRLSSGRVRFTLAHEFGHYILHRTMSDRFECTEKDMHDWDSKERILESEADLFASFLLMPLDDFRLQIQGQKISIDLLRHCAERYGTSMMAVALKWLEIAPGRVVVVAARDGFILWARSNKAAFKSGAYLPTRKKTMEVPPLSLVNRAIFVESGEVANQSAQLWFPKETGDVPLTEVVYVSEGSYPYTLGLLLMPDAEYCFEEEEDLLLSPLNLTPKSRD